MNDDIYDKVEAAIYEHGKYKKFKISYDMQDDLDSIMVQGKVRIEYAHLNTAILTNPTYLDIVVAVNDLMNIEDFGDHRYLEDISFVRREGDIQIYTMFFGS